MDANSGPLAHSGIDYVFVYGSLLSPDSLASTLTPAAVATVVGAHLLGFVRTFTVAFPNDGSQGDKAYFDHAGFRPPYVLFANVVRGRSDEGTNGVLIPLGPGDLTALTNRERRYELIDVTPRVELLGQTEAVPQSVVTFVGRSEFTDPTCTARGVLSRDYLDTIDDGVRFWDQRYPGFAQAHQTATRVNPATPIRHLTRVDGRNC